MTPKSKRGNQNRCYRWRSKNPEKYRAYMKAYMRKLRSKKKGS